MNSAVQQPENSTPADKRKLLTQLLLRKAKDNPAIYPLSHGQRALWFLYKFAPDNWAYNTLLALRINSTVNRETLRQVFQTLSDRHPSLRLQFFVQNGDPWQQVQAVGTPVAFQHIDATGWSETMLQEQVAAAGKRPFALETAPVFRVYLFTHTTTEHILLLVAHHIAIDLSSYTILVEEMRALYSIIQAGEPANLPPASQNWGDFVQWQINLTRSAEGQQLWRYWQKKLAGNLPILNLLTDHPRPPSQTFNGASYTHILSDTLTAKIRALAECEKSTLYVVLLAVWQTLLYRYTGQEDIIVGTPTAGRSQPAFTHLVGYLVNMLPLRGHPQGELPFRTFLQQIRKTVLEALDHQAYPFSVMVQNLHLQRDASRSLLFDTTFALESSRFDTQGLTPFLLGQPGAHLQWDDLSIESFDLPQQEGQFDVTLHVFEGDKTLSVAWLYNADLFDETTIVRMAGHLETLLTGITEDPEQKLAYLQLLSAAEQQQLFASNRTDEPYPNKCWHELFTAQAARYPTHVALLTAEQQVTYQELDTRSNQLAHYLQTIGVKTADRIAISLERSVDLVVGILGILKAGGTYLPLDPAYPPERLAYMLTDSQASLLLTQASLESRYHALTVKHALTVTIVCLDEWATIASYPVNEPVTAVTPHHPAYIIYTSGTTGRPKGVQVPHHGLANVSQAQHALFAIHPEERVLQFSSLSFDASVFEFTMALTNGGTLCLGSSEALLPGPNLWRFLHDFAVNIVTLPPSALAMMPHDLLPALRLITVAGEACSVELAAKWSENHLFFNLYGPTEGTIWSTFFDYTRETASLPIGTPIPNTQIYILDKHYQPVPVGVPGELYIGGAGLTHGYLHQPALTATHFIPNPFAAFEVNPARQESNGQRLYRTGDMAYYDKDGNILFLGRIDHQVKLRGYRIEPGEIEQTLSRYPSVREAVVTIRSDAPGGKNLVAYTIPQDNQSVTAAELRAFLQASLPTYMIPAAFVTIDTWPLTPNGKIDRQALPAPVSVPVSPAAPVSELENAIASIWQSVLGIPSVGIHDNFFDVGGHSLLAVQVHERIQGIVSQPINVVDIFQYPTVSQLAHHLSTVDDTTTGTFATRPRQHWIANDAIAIVGMNGRFPDAQNIHEFWHNLYQGHESVHFFDETELQTAGVDEQVWRNPRYVPAAATLANIDQFDAAFFGFTPREAEMMDPQHRLFLECTWAALEDAGYDPEQINGRIGLYAGAGLNGYLLQRQQQHHLLQNYQALISNDKDFLATRTAYELNLKGPCLSVQTACSTSLVAVHLAVQSLLHHECDLALAGGVSINLLQAHGYMYQEGAIFAPDGHCRAFDAAAQGTIFGSGVGVVVLKRLSEAQQDGDTIYAVIKGTAVNNDGAMKVGYTAPGVTGQAEVIAEALAAANIPANTIRYIEAHGTGTPLGDPIEIEALTQVFQPTMTSPHFCAIGSVKTNIGHLDAAAGIAGLIKTVLSLKYRQIPPSLHYQTPNPKIDFDRTPFYVNDRLRPWPQDSFPGRAGVSAFGIGGTNAHIILEEAPPFSVSTKRPPSPQLILLSAKTETALQEIASNLAKHLQQHTALDLADVAYTLQVGRRAFSHRRIYVCESIAEAAQTLEIEQGSTFAPEQAPGVIFMFPGQGSQYVAMGRELYEAFPYFRDQVDTCAQQLEPLLGQDLRQILFPTTPQTTASQLAETWITQPALFTIEYALARLWQRWGVSPTAMIGHSIGEYVAACLAGVFTLEDGLKLVAARGRLMQSIAPGGMLMVALPEKEIHTLLTSPFSLSQDVSIAAINEPGQCVVAGPIAAIEALTRQCNEQDVPCRRLHTSHAFHSPMMASIQNTFIETVKHITLNPPQLPYVSNVTGTWITSTAAVDPNYWGQHLRQTVQFAAGVRTLATETSAIWVEVGPGHTLSTLVRRQTEKTAVSSMPHPQETRSGLAILLRAAGHLWLHGQPINWAQTHTLPRKRLSLPTYPFTRQRYWLDILPETQPMLASNQDLAPQLVAERPLHDWFTLPSWKRLLPPISKKRQQAVTWLLFGDDREPLTLLKRTLQATQGDSVISVQPGMAFEARDETTYILSAEDPDAYHTLLAQLQQRQIDTDHIIYGWSLHDSLHPMAKNFFSLLYLVQALGAQPSNKSTSIIILSNQMQAIANETRLQPEQAMLLGLCRVIPQEYPHIVCRSIDFVWPQPHPDLLVQQILHELDSSKPAVVAYRGRDRWEPDFTTVRLDETPTRPTLLRQGGVYLITGGLGGIGLQLAAYLAQTIQAKLLLVGRSPFPDKKDWYTLLARNDQAAETIQQLLHLEEMGAEVLVLQADVTSLADMQKAVNLAQTQFGKLNGVFHAAGTAGGGIIQNLREETAVSVLSPKITGTLTLAQAIQDIPLDFCLLFSSLVSLTGGPGRASYCAANAFLDAFAHARTAQTGILTLSINWDTWQFVGMAAPNKNKTSGQINHPLLADILENSARKVVYRAWLHAATHWVLFEHKIMGHPSLAGTVYLEIVRAVVTHHTGHEQLMFSDVYFLTPLLMADDEEREVRISLTPTSDGFQFQVQSQDRIEWQTHAQGHIALFATAEHRQHSFIDLQRQCPNRIDVQPDALAHEHIELGSRWHSLQTLYIGRGEVLADIRLAEDFASDLAAYQLHPALLDAATSFAGQYAAQGSYLPLSYKRILYQNPLPLHFYSHARYQSPADTAAETITVDVTLFDEVGTELVVVTGFTLKRTTTVQWQELAQATANLTLTSTYTGMLPEEALETLGRILTYAAVPQIIVSRRPLSMVLEQVHMQATGSQKRIQDRTTYDRTNITTPYAPPRSEIEQTLSDIWQDLLGISPIGVEDNFFELGGDSVVVIQILARARESGLHFTPNQFFSHQTIAELAQVADTAKTIETDQSSITGLVPLSPIQSWFFEQVFLNPHHWNQSLMLTVQHSLDVQTLTQAVQLLLAHHDALRLRFYFRDAQWQQESTAATEYDEDLVVRVDLSTLPLSVQEQQITHLTQQWQCSLKLDGGILFRALYLHMGHSQPDRLLLTAHHLILDAFSWPILLADLQAAYTQLNQKQPVLLPGKTHSFKAWVEDLHTQASKPTIENEASYWLSPEWQRAASLPLDFPANESQNIEASVQRSVVTLSHAETAALLQDVPRAYHTNTTDILLAALVQTLAHWTGETHFLIATEADGRETAVSGTDYSRTVGWFTTLIPVLLTHQSHNSGEAIRHTKEQLRTIPNQGLSYGLLRYIANDEKMQKLHIQPQPQISFLYLGRLEQRLTDTTLITTVNEADNNRSNANRRTYFLDVIAKITDQQLRVEWLYSNRLHHQDTIATISKTYQNILQVLIQHCQTLETSQYTPSDFPEADLNQDELDALVSLFAAEDD